MATRIPDDLNLSNERDTSLVEKILSKLWIQYRNKIDRYIIFVKERWIVTSLLLILYIIRVFSSGGFYVISYVLGLYILHALVKFVTPLGLPDIEEEEEERIGEDLPMTNDYQTDSKPLIRSVSEFQFWQGVTIAIVISNILISTEALNLPVYWPFLLGYFIFLTVITLKKQIRHQQKYGYNFFDFWKKGKA